MRNDSAVLEAVELVTGEIEALVSLWRRAKELNLSADEYADDAVEILSTWAHLHRFKGVEEPEFDAFVKKERENLVEAALNSPIMQKEGLEEWLKNLDHLESLADNASCDQEVIETGQLALEMFCQLDDAQLACWAIERLGMGNRIPQETKELLLRCHGELSLRASLFAYGTPGDYVSMMSEAYRDDLLGYDPHLYLITEKFLVVTDQGDLLPFGEEEETEDVKAALCASTSASTSSYEPEVDHTESLMDIEKWWEEVKSRFKRIPTWFPQPAAAFIGAAATQEPFKEHTLLFEAYDGSWKGFVHVPSKVEKKQTVLSLWLDDEKGSPITKGTLIIGDLEFPVKDGRALVTLEGLLLLWNTKDRELKLVVNGNRSQGRMVDEDHQHGEPERQT